MKNFSLLQIFALVALVITVASCGFAQPVYDEDYPDRSSSRVYHDPYYGGVYDNRSTIIRDPYTGQYYEVRPVGPYASYPDTYYGNTYPSRRSAYPSRSNTRTYDNRDYRSQNTTREYPQRSESQTSSGSSSKKIDDTRKIINGQ